jgi:hypothetical protein
MYAKAELEAADEKTRQLNPRPPPGKEDLAWVTNTITLKYGERDAVLVDTFLSVQHSKQLMDWIVESGKNLTTIMSLMPTATISSA